VKQSSQLIGLTFILTRRMV